MRIIPPEQFVTMPWKNGGGITHEIAKLEHDGNVAWRFSIADVDSDGPFSSFPGLSRILTVLEGEGLQLAGPDKSNMLTALPFAPVAFPGNMPIQGIRIGGKVRDFNVMYDPLRYTADVTVRDGAEALSVMTEHMLAVMMTAGGRVNGTDVAPMSCILMQAETASFVSAGRIVLAELRLVHSN